MLKRKLSFFFFDESFIFTLMFVSSGVYIVQYLMNWKKYEHFFNLIWNKRYCLWYYQERNASCIKPHFKIFQFYTLNICLYMAYGKHHAVTKTRSQNKICLFAFFSFSFFSVISEQQINDTFSHNCVITTKIIKNQWIICFDKNEMH